jgi:surface polysaccharide O-acyltransferase-like enzyme
VIFHHTAIAYGASGGWCYVTPDTVKGTVMIILSSILTVDQAFFMSLFFFISAYMMPGSFDRKGAVDYLKDRFMRLGVPLVIYSLIIGPVLNYAIQVHIGSSPGNVFSFVLNNIIRYPSTGHMWFVLALLIFESFYATYRSFPELPFSRFISNNIPSHRNIAIFILACGIIAFLLRTVYPIGGKNIIGLQFGYFTLYTAMYILGIIAKRKNWIDKLSINGATIWFLIALAVIPLIVAAWFDLTRNPAHMTEYTGGFHWRSLFLSFWEAIVCVGFCYFSIMAFKKYLNNSTNLSVNLASDSYAAYIIHPVIVVGMTFLLEPVHLSPLLKFLIAFPIIVIICFMLAHCIRKIPGFKKVV